MNNIHLLITLYIINLCINLSNYKKVFNISDNSYIFPELQSLYIIKFFILSIFQLFIIYLLVNDLQFEAKPLILISYGIAIPLYSIEYINNISKKKTDKLDQLKDLSLFIIKSITSTLAIYIIWSKKTFKSGLMIFMITGIIMLLPIIITKLTNNNSYSCQQDPVHDKILNQEQEQEQEQEQYLDQEQNLVQEEQNTKNQIYKNQIYEQKKPNLSYC